MLRFGKPRAVVGRILPQEFVTKIHKLFLECGGESIPLLVIPSLYKHAYGEVLDATELGFEDGLIGFFKELSNIFTISYREQQLVCSLRQQHISNLPNGKSALDIITKAKSDSPSHCCYSRFVRVQDCHGLLNSDCILWQEPYMRELLEYRNLVIPISPLQSALSRDPVRVQQQVFTIHLILKQYPDGVPLSDLANMLVVDKRLFNVTSIDSMVTQYPEIFYIEDQMDGELLIFDGKTYCHSNRGCGQLLENLTAEIEVYCWGSVRSGLYQKTVILIREAGDEGLRLCVWKQAIENNFKKSHMPYVEEILLNLNPITLFIMLELKGMITIKASRNSLNDLRLHIPTNKIDLIALKEEADAFVAAGKRRREESS